MLVKQLVALLLRQDQEATIVVEADDETFEVEGVNDDEEAGEVIIEATS